MLGILVKSIEEAPPDPTVLEAMSVYVFAKTVTLPFVIGLLGD